MEALLKKVMEPRDHKINSTDSLKYLRIHLDAKLNLKTHATRIPQRTDKANKLLRRIMPNTKGPCNSIRNLLAMVPHSIMLYGATVWQEHMLLAGYKSLVKSQQK